MTISPSTKEPAYWPTSAISRALNRLRPTGDPLSTVAMLPLIDGVFISQWSSGAFATWSGAALSGIALFSGGACVAEASKLIREATTIKEGVIRLAATYARILAMTILLLPVLPLVTVVAPTIQVAVDVILVGILLAVAGFNFTAANQALPTGALQTWLWCLRLVQVPPAVLLIAILIAAVEWPKRIERGWSSDAVTGISVTGEPLYGVVLHAVLALSGAFTAAATLTMVAAVLTHRFAQVYIIVQVIGVAALSNLVLADFGLDYPALSLAIAIMLVVIARKCRQTS